MLKFLQLLMRMLLKVLFLTPYCIKIRKIIFNVAKVGTQIQTTKPFLVLKQKLST